MTRTEALRKLYKKITNEEAPVGANTTTEALQKVYEALTNDTTHHINVTEIIDDLAANWSEGGGGGGSSDFSTATVTVTSNSIDGDGTEFPFAYVDRESSAIHYGAVAEYNNSLIYEAILFNGGVGFASPTSNVSTSGSATVNPRPGGGTFIVITGDCTITISGAPTPN